MAEIVQVDILSFWVPKGLKSKWAMSHVPWTKHSFSAPRLCQLA